MSLKLVVLYLVIVNCVAFDSLLSGKWFKLICGASNQEVASIRNLCYIYTVAGVDCIDLAADSAVINAAYDGIKSAMMHYHIRKPLIMVSVNDGNDAHFRKASFDAALCPSNCPRPCERICPAVAIDHSGVLEDRCYGCGRCIKACPLHLISEKAVTLSPISIKNLFMNKTVGQIIDAIEIHTNQSHEFQFFQLLSEIGQTILPKIHILAVSCPDFGGDETIQYLSSLQDILISFPHWNAFKGVQIWQTDGNPMRYEFSFLIAMNESYFRWKVGISCEYLVTDRSLSHDIYSQLAEESTFLQESTLFN